MSLLIRIPGPFNSKLNKVTNKQCARSNSVTYDLSFTPAAICVYVNKWRHSIADHRNISVDKITFGGEYFANVYNSRDSKCALIVPKYPKSSPKITVDYSMYGPKDPAKYSDYALLIIVLNKEEYEAQKMLKHNAYNTISTGINHVKVSNNVHHSMFYNVYYDENNQLAYNEVVMGVDKEMHGYPNNNRDKKDTFTKKPFNKNTKKFDSKRFNGNKKFDKNRPKKMRSLIKPYFREDN